LENAFGPFFGPLAKSRSGNSGTIRGNGATPSDFALDFSQDLVIDKLI